MTVSLRHRLEYAGVVGLRALLRVVPMPLRLALGTLTGIAFYAFDGAHRRVALSQIRAAFPTRSAAECRAITRATFVHFGRALVLLLDVSRLAPDALRRRVEYDGEDRVRAALSAGKGLIIVTGHFGYWELQGVAHALVLPPLAVLARPLDNPLLHALLERIRTATGNTVIYKQGGLRRVLRVLAHNGSAGILIDQHIHGTDAVRVDFFGRPAATTSALALLALRTGAALVPAFALPTAGGRFRLVFEPPVEMPAADAADPVRELTQRCTDILEMYVRRYPHLWLWMHRRWRDEAEATSPARWPTDAEPLAPRDEHEEPSF
jgi:KDO2-lipid IV(A) lauroyltransferase